jgi:transposase-like protein
MVKEFIGMDEQSIGVPNQYTVRDNPPWKNREKIAEAYQSDKPVQDIADDWDCSTATIHYWVREFDIERRECYDGPWRDKQKMYDLYWGEMLSTAEIAERVGCTQPTISDWLNKHGIPTRYTAQEYGQISTTERGYEYFAVDCELVWIHRLLAVAEHGFDEVVGKQVHHKSDVPWDNRPENVEPVTDAEHIKRHRDKLLKALRD